MAWAQEDNKRGRARVAHELDRRAFWKQVFLVCKQQGNDTDDSILMADYALKGFENKFPPLHGAS